MIPDAKVGVSGFAVYVPPYRVKLDAWCEWTGASWDKVRSVVGRSFRMRGPRQNVYTMAATAVLRLILRYEIDPQRIGYLALGTESSTDNAAGAIIVRGMVDRALQQLDKPPLARHCEVPEFKHACLGGVYGIKNALRYLACDGRGRQAIVVAADVAEYERGSSGEQTQGAGAVALLLENNPKIFAIDLAQCGSSSDYRGPDFRKPLQVASYGGPANAARAGSGAARNAVFRDFPVFNGHYSTTCYVDAVLHALSDLYDRLGGDARGLYHDVAAIFSHRPYHRMPMTAMAVAYLAALSRSPDHHGELAVYCTEASVSLDAVLQELQSSPDLFAAVQSGQTAPDVYPATMAAAKAFRRTPIHERVVSQKMLLGADAMMDLGNLYTASLPAWLAAGLEEAASDGLELAGQRLLAVGYGSGDAAESMLLHVVPNWQVAASRVGFAEAMQPAIDLTQAQYEALHDGKSPQDLNATLIAALRRPMAGEFVVERVGKSYDKDFHDIGIEYYQFCTV